MTDVQQQASAPAAGWYPDPVRPGSTRYWSGTGWTDQVSTPEPEPVVPPVSAFAFDIAPVVEAPPATFAVAPPAPREIHATQSEWHQSRARPIQRMAVAPVSTTTRSSAMGRQNDPYDRNWIAGVAIALAILSIPGIAARVLWDLPPLTQSIFAGAPIGVALLALARAGRHRSGLVLSIVAMVIAVGTLLVGLFVDPAVIRSIVESLAGLLPA